MFGMPIGVHVVLVVVLRVLWVSVVVVFNLFLCRLLSLRQLYRWVTPDGHSI